MKGSKTFRLVPQISKRSAGPHVPHLRTAVTAWLHQLGWREADSPQVVVLLLRSDDKVVLNDLKLIRELGGAAAMLVVDAHGRCPMFLPDLDSSMRVMRQIDLVETREVEKWLVGLSRLKLPMAHVRRANQIRERLLVDLPLPYQGTTAEKIEKYTDDENVSGRIGRTTASLLSSDMGTDFYYGLLRLETKYNRLEHDLNKLTPWLNEGTQSPQSLNKLVSIQLLQRFVNSCHDLLTAQRYPLPEPMAFTRTRRAALQNVILLVDDRPDAIRHAIADILGDYCPNYELWVWNPMERLPPEQARAVTIDHVVQYNSMRPSLISDDDQIRIYDSQREPSLLPFGSAIRRCAYILVDILFERFHGREEELGPRFIGGLRRILGDLFQREGKGALLRVPEIIAISRADDLEKVQASLRAGASGYVLKTRLLSIPGALGRVRHLVEKSPGDGQGNFRALGRLSSEALSLLKGARIPPVDVASGTFAVGSPERAAASLIAAAPKTDVHVHVGSVMSPEFLVIASVVMLAQPLQAPRTWEMIRAMTCLWSSDNRQRSRSRLDLRLTAAAAKLPVWFHPLRGAKTKASVHAQFDWSRKLSDRERLKAISDQVRNHLKREIRGPNDCGPLRSVLHKALGIPDFWDVNRTTAKIDSIADLELFLFAHRYGSIPGYGDCVRSHDHGQNADATSNILRTYLLFLASRGDKGYRLLPRPNLIGNQEIDVLLWFSGARRRSAPLKWDSLWKSLGVLLFRKTVNRKWRRGGWRIPKKIDLRNLFEVRNKRSALGGGSPTSKLMAMKPSWNQAPLVLSIATGLGCRNLREYLQGAEFSGAEHLKHPFLVHLYAQQTVYAFVQQGILYAELRASPDGYVNSHPQSRFTMQDAVTTLQRAFADAQYQLIQQYRRQKHKRSCIWLCDGTWPLNSLFTTPDGPRDVDRVGPFRRDLFAHPRFPVKIGLILGGKRHKPTRQLLREMAASIVLSEGETVPGHTLAASSFALEDMKTCRFVGFDLSGQEEGFRPGLFRNHFEQLSRLHIPITVHAGENASAEFIEEAVLDLRASRIGHGLAMVDDGLLMNRVRENRVCVELCPVSNYQTNQYMKGQDPRGRTYPLREYIKNGNAVCINTDNPIISYTNIVKEYFQAAYAYDPVLGMSFWEGLRIMRRGFLRSFMSLPERRAIMELADQLLFDLFSRETTLNLLRELVAAQAKTSVRK